MEAGVFQTEATRCRDNAKMAMTKADREFWLNMANRKQAAKALPQVDPQIVRE
jgi:hypothetical protein